MRITAEGFDFSQSALASSVRAASGRIAYLSKSKKTSRSSGMLLYSAGAGRGGGGAGGAAATGGGVAGAGAGGGTTGEGAGAGAGAGGAVTAAPVGGGGAAWEMAGRLAQPAAAMSISGRANTRQGVRSVMANFSMVDSSEDRQFRGQLRECHADDRLPS